ncbi:hypothetical protein RB195_005427 [Necator americanus]|uniref:Uncharacterized protein n=1 Tax=Necator americanus TaxID=51031 RepID=A0ABR1BR05_NECAM
MQTERNTNWARETSTEGPVLKRNTDVSIDDDDVYDHDYFDTCVSCSLAALVKTHRLSFHEHTTRRR